MLMKLTPAINFINVFRANFTYLSLFISKEKMFVWKPRAKNVDEIDTWCQFHQCSTSSFCKRRSRKHKKSLTTWQPFCAFGIYTCKRKKRVWSKCEHFSKLLAPQWKTWSEDVEKGDTYLGLIPLQGKDSQNFFRQIRKIFVILS